MAKQIIKKIEDFGFGPHSFDGEWKELTEGEIKEKVKLEGTFAHLDESVQGEAEAALLRKFAKSAEKAEAEPAADEKEKNKPGKGK